LKQPHELAFCRQLIVDPHYTIVWISALEANTEEAAIIPIVERSNVHPLDYLPLPTTYASHVALFFNQQPLAGPAMVPNEINIGCPVTAMAFYFSLIAQP
jgi:hypothetical protein